MRHVEKVIRTSGCDSYAFSGRSVHRWVLCSFAVNARRFVEDSDVAEAIRLMQVATQNAATDPRTGTIDMDMIATGQGASDRCAAFFCLAPKLTSFFNVILWLTSKNKA